MEHKTLPIMAKRLWETVRVIFFMLRKGLSAKRKLLVDLNLMLKRGNKIATKALGNLIFHHHHHDGGANFSFTAPPNEYEFSCSNSPMYTLPFHANNKRKHHLHHHNQQNGNLFSCAFKAPPTLDDDVTTINAVKLALDMLNHNGNNEIMAEAPSPMLPGFGWSPMVKQLRITDSPFPLKDDDDDNNGVVDKKAEEFIEKFYKELRKQQKKC